MQKMSRGSMVLWLIAAAAAVIFLGVLALAGGFFLNRYLSGRSGETAQACQQGSLEIGGLEYPVDWIPHPQDNRLDIPGNAKGTAYWIENTDSQPVIVLNPKLETLAWEPTIGSEIILTRADCAQSNYALVRVETALPPLEILLDQAAPGIVIFYQGSAGGVMVLWGEPSGHGDTPAGEIPASSAPGGGDQAGTNQPGSQPAEITPDVVIDAFPTPDPASIQAEVSLLETGLLADGMTLRVTISILNYAQNPLIVSSGVVQLTDANGAGVVLESASPTLPVEIGSGESQEIELYFIKPASAIATLEIFGAPYDLDY